MSQPFLFSAARRRSPRICPFSVGKIFEPLGYRLLPSPLSSRNRLRGGKNKGQELHLLEDYGRKLKAKKMHALTIIQRKCPEGVRRFLRLCVGRAC
jgi:hypothetical protein